MKKLLLMFCFLSLALTLTFGGGKKEESQPTQKPAPAAAPQQTPKAEVKVGPIVDKVYVNVKMKEEIALKDVAEGVTDIFFWGVDGPVIMGLDQATRDKLDLYSVPSGSWSLLFNPIPNQAPYTVEVEGKSYFNPFAIRDVRFAMNNLINRKYIVDEILAGAGGPQMTMATPGQPGTYRYNLVASRMGISAEGDEPKAIADITAALQKAAALPALQGKLQKGDTWWEFNGEPVSIKFLIRVDDPNGRLKEGDYVALQIEKAGIKVERLYWDRSKCGNAVYGGNPADYQWNLYTEGWGAGATRAFWEHIVCQMYAPWYGYMPGGQDPNNWNYQNAAIDAPTKKAYSGNFLNEKEYWQLALEGLDLGLKDAVRMYVCYQNNYFATNKARFKNRMAYGLGDGLNKWSMVTANTTDGILRVTGYSAKGALFMNPWDPVGTDGFSDVYSGVCAEPSSDVAMFESPATAIATPLLAVPRDVDTQVSRDSAGDVVGDILVPKGAIMYDSAKKRWAEVAPGTKVMSKATYSFKLGAYHHGRPITLAALLYRDALRIEWMNKDSDDDPYFDQSFESNIKPLEETLIGYMLNKDGSITSYFNYNFPASKPRVAAWGAPGLTVLSGRYVNVSWEILEACAKLVAEGSASGTTYSFTYGQATDVDVLQPSCVADIRAKLVEMRDNKYVPVSIKDYMTVDNAVASYEAAIKWIDEHGHAFISTGPFYVDKYDAASNYMELTAFRNPAYPYKSDYWPNYFKTTILRIDGVDLPASFAKDSGKDLAVNITVSAVLYPAGTARPADQGDISIMLITPTDELAFKAKKTGAGTFQAAIPAATLKALAAGNYTIIVDAELKGGMPASSSVSTTLY